MCSKALQRCWAEVRSFHVSRAVNPVTCACWRVGTTHPQDIAGSLGAISKPKFFSIELPDHPGKVLELVDVLGVDGSVRSDSDFFAPRCEKLAVVELRLWDTQPSRFVGNDCPLPRTPKAARRNRKLTKFSFAGLTFDWCVAHGMRRLAHSGMMLWTSRVDQDGAKPLPLAGTAPVESSPLA